MNLKIIDMTKLTKLKNSEYHYLIDCEIMVELLSNRIPFSHHISPDVELSYLIIDIEM